MALRTADDTAKAVLDFIIRTKNPPGEGIPGELQVSHKGIADHIGCSISTVHRALQQLSAAGYIIVRPPADKRLPNIISYLGVEEERPINTVLSIVQRAMNDLQRASDILSHSPAHRLLFPHLDDEVLQVLATHEVLTEISRRKPPDFSRRG